MSSPSSSQPSAIASALPRTSAAPRSMVLIAFAAVYVLWGSTYFFIRIGIETIPPFVLAGIRHVAIGLVFYPLFRYQSKEKPTAAQWRTTIITGLLLLLCGNGALSWAETRVPSGIASLLVATVSLWMVILDWLRPCGVRPAPRVLIGFVLGFAGIALLVGPSHLGGSERVNPLGAVILILGSLAWAAGSIYSRHHPVPHSPLLGVAMQSLAGGAGLWIVAAATGELHQFHPAQVTLRSWLAVLYLFSFGSALGFSAYIYILKHSTASRVATYAFVNPVVALFLGWSLGGEAISLRTLIASGTILAAVLLVILAPHKPADPPDEIVPCPGEA
ncbi:MAG TPA: EamA family transporter [Candidatus Limnocylindrales bacterium]|nr:EamA family transporter [Candidatus Limnocylindrales bacterium]